MKNLKTNWLIKHSITVFSCVLIIVLGITALTFADPVTTSIGENISTNSFTATGLTVMNADGGNQHWIGQLGFAPRWSSDGSRFSKSKLQSLSG